MEKNLKELADNVIQAVFDLSTHLWEQEGLMIGAAEDRLDSVREIISKALDGYPLSQIGLLIECLLAESRMDTSEEAAEAMQEDED